MSDPILNPGTCVSCGKEGGYIMWCEECIRGGNAEKQVVTFVENLFDPKQMTRELRDLLGTVKEQEQKIENLEEDTKRLRAEADDRIKAHSQLATELKNANLQIGELTRVLDLFVHPMKMKCEAVAHNGGVIASCACRDNAILAQGKAVLKSNDKCTCEKFVLVETCPVHGSR